MSIANSEQQLSLAFEKITKKHKKENAKKHEILLSRIFASLFCDFSSAHAVLGFAIEQPLRDAAFTVFNS
jgi:hypothetical protein